MWNVARTQAEIQGSMLSTLSGGESGLVSYYPFEDGTGSSIVSDASGNGNDGTLSGINPSIDWIASTAPIAGASGPTVTLIVTDSNGNTASCEASVTVEDNVDPIALCQDLTIQLDDNGMASITANDVDTGSNDACGVTLSIDQTEFDCSHVGANTVTLTVTDDNGNVSTCESTVTVEDNVDPIALCQDLTIQLDDNGMASITAADIDAGSSDACGITLSIDCLLYTSPSPRDS